MDSDDRYWRPRADTYRGADQHSWVIKLDLAGVRLDDVVVSIESSRLFIRGVRRDVSVRQGLRPYSMEISYSRFERAIDLPELVDISGLSTEYVDGMLLVRVTGTIEEKS